MPDITHQTNHWLLIANGQALSNDKLLRLAINKRIMVLDGAYDHLKKSGLRIDISLGDFDSINPDFLPKKFTLEGPEIECFQSDHTTFVHIPNQNQTDLQKGLEFLIDHQGAKKISICQATGHRLDHSLWNLRMLKRFHDLPCELELFTETELVRYAENTEIYFHGQKKDGFAILGFPYAKVSTRGLKYEMIDYLLDFEKQSSICNELATEEVKIVIEGQALFIHSPQLFSN